MRYRDYFDRIFNEIGIVKALNGLDFTLFRPRLIFIEISKWDQINFLKYQLDFFENVGYEFHSNPGGFNPLNQSISQNTSKEGNFSFIDSNIKN